MAITLKYIDPTYMIRTTEANASDRNRCAQLAQNAVHGLMAGFTGFTTGHVNNKVAFIPIDELLSGKYPNKVQPDSRIWQRLLASTGQPSFLNNEL
jgi:6-phosphofructokinase 1